MNKADSYEMRLEQVPRCSICGSPGAILYENLDDRLFGSAGTWSIRRCTGPTCGSLWLDPRPIQDDIGAAYADYYTHERRPIQENIARRLYDWLVRGYVAGRFRAKPEIPSRLQRLAGWLLYLLPGKRAVVEYLAGHLDVPDSGRLLEIGCGGGEALAFTRSLGWEVCGIEIDPAAATVARQRGLDVRVGRAEEQQLPAATFDAIVMNHVIEHLHDPKSLLAECRRLLRPGGRLVLVTPNPSSLWHRVFGKAWMPLDPPRHLQLFSPAALTQLVATSGYDVRRCRTSIRDADRVFVGSRAIQTEGSHRMALRPSLPLRLAGTAMQLVEAAVSLLDRNAGEEIVLIATRP